MRTRTSLALIFSLITCTALTSAADISAYPKKMHAYVNDFANIIDDATEKSLNETLKAYDTSTTNEFIVATFPELKGNLEETTLELFRTWGIGKADKNNGLVFFVFVKDENGKGKTRIEVGKGLEGVLPDSKTKLIYEHDVRPFLVKHDFTGGIQACMTKLMQASVNEYAAAPIAAATNDSAPVGLFIFVFIVILIVVGVLFIWLMNSSSQSEREQKAAYKYERAASKTYTPAPKPTATPSPSYGADRYSSSSPSPSSYSAGAKVGAGVVGGVVAGGVAASLLSKRKPAPSYPSYSGTSSNRPPVASSSGVAIVGAATAAAAAASAAAIAAAAAKRKREEEEAEEEEERRRRRRRDDDSSSSYGGGSSDSGSSFSWGSSDSGSSSSFDSGGGSCDGGGSSGDF